MFLFLVHIFHGPFQHVNDVMFYFLSYGAVTDCNEVIMYVALCPIEGCYVFLLIDSGFSHSVVLFYFGDKSMNKAMTRNMNSICGNGVYYNELIGITFRQLYIYNFF